MGRPRRARGSPSILIRAAAVTLLATVASAYEPVTEDLFRPSSGPPPTREQANAVVEALRDAVRDGRVDDAWLAENVRPAHLPTGPEPAMVARTRAALGPTGALRVALMHTPGPIATTFGPDYARVVLGGRPLLSVVVRADGDGAVIDRFEVTSCALCGERARFVRDLLADVARRGLDAKRLLPGVELDITDHLDANGYLVGEKWVGTLVARNQQAGELVALLRDARVVDAHGEQVTVEYGDGTTDTWRIVYRNSKWKVHYHSLADNSPLRMSSREMRQWRSQRKLSATALQQWEPTWVGASGGAGLLVGQRAIGADFDPRDGTVLVSVLDMDRVLAGLFRVDPAARDVTDRWRLPTFGMHALLQLGGWFSQWRMALSPDGTLVTVTRPGRVWTLDLATSKVRQVYEANGVTVLDYVWPDPSEPPRLVIGRVTGDLTLIGPSTIQHARVLGTPVAIRQEGNDAVTVTAEGRVVPFRWDGRAPEQPSLDVCCDGVTDAAFQEGGQELVVTCAPVCSTSAERVDRRGGESTTLSGAGVHYPAASWSPDRRWFTTGAGDDRGAILWDALENTPIARLGHEPARSVRWSSDATQVLTVETDGDVWLWDLAKLRKQAAL